MARKSVLIIGSDFQWEERQLLQEAKDAGYDAEYLAAGSIILELDEKEADIRFAGLSIRERLKESILIFRRARGAQQVMTALSVLAKQWGIPATDSPESIASNIDKSLSLPAISLRHIRHIPGCFLLQQGPLNTAQINLPLPLLAKPVLGRHGEGIRILEDEASLEEFLEKRGDDGYILQRYLPLKAEYRIFVVGKASLGIIRKIPADGSLVANYAAGARFERDEVPQEIVDEAIDICIKQGIDIGGVDIALSGEQYYLLEVNRCPEFRAFEGATNAGVAKAVITFLSGL